MTASTFLLRVIQVAPRSSITHALGSALHLGAQTAQLILIGHMLGSGVVGLYGYCLALITPVVLLANWHVRHARVMDASGRFTWDTYTRLRTWSFLASVPVLAGGLLLPALEGFSGVYLCLALLRLTEMWFDLHYSIFQRTGEIGRIGIGVGMRGFFSAIVFGVAFTLSDDLNWGVLAQVGASWGWWYVMERPVLMRSRQLLAEPSGGHTSVLKLLGHLWPLGITVALGSLMAMFPRIALADQHSLEEAGRFILLGYLFIPAVLLHAPMQQATAPRLAELAAGGNRAGLITPLMRLSIRQILVLVAVAAGIMGFQEGFGLHWIMPGLLVTPGELMWFLLGQCAGVLVNSSGLAMDALGRYRIKLLYWCTLATLGAAVTWWMAASGIVGVGMAAVVVGLSGAIVGGAWTHRAISKPPDTTRVP